MDPDLYDCIVVGAGPAGLSAALYLARYRRRTLVLHDDSARALRIPKTHNAPGFADGISGPDLIERMTRHAAEYGAQFDQARVSTAATDGDGFVLSADDGRHWRSRAVILATGINLNQIDLPHDDHEQAIHDNILRYCPVCDAYEHIDRRIGIIGCDESGAAEALFMRRYSRDITLIPRVYAELDPDENQQMADAGIRVIEPPVERYEPGSREMRIWLKGVSDPLSFDVIYPALGVTPRTGLAVQLGIAVDRKGRCSPDSVFQTAVPGAWCAGDIVDGLDQISVAMGHGAIAGTKAHNWLRERDGHTLD